MGFQGFLSLEFGKTYEKRITKQQDEAKLAKTLKH